MSIQEDMNAITRDVVEIQNKRDDKALWLFIATVGCWGIPHEVDFMQVIAFIIIFIYFFRISFQLSYKEYPYDIFKVSCDALINKIRDELKDNPDEMKKAIGSVKKLQDKRNKISWVAQSCWYFSSISLMIVLGIYLEKLTGFRLQ